MQTQAQSQPDPVIAALRKTIDDAVNALNEYVAQKAVTESELERLSGRAAGGHSANSLTVEQVAERFGATPGTVREGVGKFECLYKAAYKPGKRLMFPLRAVEIHERNLQGRGKLAKCGECYKQAPPLHVVKKGK